MKRLLLCLAALCSFSPIAHAFPIIGYVQITTGAVQTGGFSTQTGKVGTFTDTGLAANQCVQTGVGGLLTTSGAICGSAAGGASSLEVLAGVSRTSPTVTVGFPAPQFTGSVTAASMTVTLNASSVTLQGNTNVALLNSTQTFTGTNIFTSSATNIAGMIQLGRVARGAFIGSNGVGAGNTSAVGTNIGIGGGALGNLTSGGNNTAIGYQAATSLTTGSGNMILGQGALANSLVDVANFAGGVGAGGQLRGSSNTLVGYQSGYSATETSLQMHLGDGVTLVGYRAGVATSSPLVNAIAIGYTAVVGSSNTAQIGGTLGSGTELMLQATSATVNQMTVSNLVNGQCVQAGSGGLLTASGGTCGGGSGGSSALQVTSSGLQITSPTASMNFYSPDFLLGAIGSTSTIALNSATTDFIHNQTTLQSGSTFYVSSATVATQFNLPYTGTAQVLLSTSGGNVTSTQDVTVHYANAILNLIDTSNPFAIGNGYGLKIVVNGHTGLPSTAYGVHVTMGNGTAGDEYAFYSDVNGANAGNNYGAHISGTAGVGNYGLWASAPGGGKNYAIWVDSGQVQINSSMTVTGSQGSRFIYGVTAGSFTVANYTSLTSTAIIVVSTGSGNAASIQCLGTAGGALSTEGSGCVNIGFPNGATMPSDGFVLDYSSAVSAQLGVRPLHIIAGPSFNDPIELIEKRGVNSAPGLQIRAREQAGIELIDTFLSQNLAVAAGKYKIVTCGGGVDCMTIGGRDPQNSSFQHGIDFYREGSTASWSASGDANIIIKSTAAFGWTNYAGSHAWLLRPNDTMAATYLTTLPSGYGTNNQAWVGNGAGQLNYVSVVVSTESLQSGTTFYVSSGTVSGQLRVGTLQGAGLSTCGDSSHALNWTGGSFGCQTLTSGGGGSGAPIAITTGVYATTYSNPAISSPLAVGVYNQNQFDLSATGTTGYIQVKSTFTFFNLTVTNTELGPSFNSTLTSTTVTGSGGFAVAGSTGDGLISLQIMGSTYTVIASSMVPTVAGQYAVFSSTSGTVIGVTLPTSGSSSASTLAVTTGSTAGFASVASSPTAVINFDQSQFLASLPAGATAFISIRPAISTPTANYTFTSTSTVALADATAGSLTVTLPTAVGITGKRFTIKRTNSGANTVTIATTSSQTIDGASTVVITSQWASIDVISDGANWFIL